MEKFPKTVYEMLHILNTGDERERWSKPDYLLVFKKVLIIVEFVHFILVLDHALLHSYPHH